MSEKHLYMRRPLGSRFGKSLRRILGALCLFAAPPLLAADTIASLLKIADGHRIPSESAKVDTLVELYRDNVLDKERLYTVYIKPGRRSLILMKSPSETGQKVLMLAEQFWLLMPDSQRPMRITATQKLLGEASTGDIASMTWSEDYEGSTSEETDCPTPPASIPEPLASNRERHCLRLDLSAAHSGVTYARVVLYLEKGSKVPVKADLFVGSGKRAKEAWYFPKIVDGKLRIATMVLLDDIQANRRTVVRYRSMVPKAAPDEFFNPAALIRNSLTNW